jgi:hypothetical protein
MARRNSMGRRPAVLPPAIEPARVALRDYPFVMVRLACHRCERQERFRRERLIEEHGPDISMGDLQDRLIVCEQRHRAGQFCRAFYPDLISG